MNECGILLKVFLTRSIRNTLKLLIRFMLLSKQRGLNFIVQTFSMQVYTYTSLYILQD